MKTVNEIDQFGFEQVIRKVFAGKPVEFFENFDDVYAGWIVGVSASTSLIVKYGHSNPLYLFIYRISIGHMLPITGKCKCYVLFYGTLPADEEMCPDLQFLKQIISNWNRIGYEITQ